MNFLLAVLQSGTVEIRGVACEMLRLAKEKALVLFQYAGPPCLAGKCPEGKMSCGNMKVARRFLGTTEGEQPSASLIVIEGLDGSGKGTQASLLYDRLQQAGFPVKKNYFS